MSQRRHACPCLAVAGEHSRRPDPAQVAMTDERPSGPLPEVLARLAADMPASETGRGPSPAARVLGYVLCTGTAIMVVVTAIMVAHP
jgi:hypothetical protein